MRHYEQPPRNGAQLSCSIPLWGLLGVRWPLLPLANHADLEAMPNGGDGVGLSRQTRRLPADGLTRLLPPQLDIRSSVAEEDDLGSPERLTPKPKVWRGTAPHSAAGGSETLEFRTGMEQAHYRPVRQVGSQKRISDRARQLSESLSCSNPDAVISRLRVGTESSSRDNFLAGQESDWGTRPRIALPGILQSNILSSQERRRLASDLKSLNQFVRKVKFKMTTPRVVINALHHGDWVVSVDIKDAYFHIPIHKKSRHLLRFAVETGSGFSNSGPYRSDWLQR